MLGASPQAFERARALGAYEVIDGRSELGELSSVDLVFDAVDGALSEAAAAFERSLASGEHGKVVLRVAGDGLPFAHAGVLVTLALVGQMLADAAALDGVDDFFARTGIGLLSA